MRNNGFPWPSKATMALNQSGPLPAEKLATVNGNNSSDDAKIGGITPAVLSFNGKWELSACDICMPIWRLGYWIKRRRWARSKNTMKATTPTATMRMPRIIKGDIRPLRPNSNKAAIPVGKLATMPEKIISDVPLPMPRAVICSPSHIRNTVPPVSVITVERIKNGPGVNTRVPCAVKPAAMP